MELVSRMRRCSSAAISPRLHGPTPPVLGPRFDPNHDTVAATVAFFKAAAHDERLHQLRNVIAFCRDVEGGHRDLLINK